MAEQKDKVVLAYSGGLDTSCCIKWLQDEMNLDVIAVVGDVGQEHDGLEKVKEKALRVGALECIVVDMRQMFAQEYLTKALAANAMYENKYPLVSALSRPLISKHLVDAAHKFGAKYIAHGCTGKGNDQVRFESSITMLDPSLKILAPVREWNLLTRPDTRELLAYIDVLVDGPFILAERDLSLRFRGSRNQRLIDVRRSISGKQTVEFQL